MISLLFWHENAAMSFLPSLSSEAACSAEQLPHACFRFKSTTEWSTGQIIFRRKVFWEASFSTQRNGSFKTKSNNRNKTCWTIAFPYFHLHETLAAVLTSVIVISLVLRGRLTRASREMVGLHHDHYRARSNPFYCLSLPAPRLNIWIKSMESYSQSCIQCCQSCIQLKYYDLWVTDKV